MAAPSVHTPEKSGGYPPTPKANPAPSSLRSQRATGLRPGLKCAEGGQTAPPLHPPQTAGVGTTPPAYATGASPPNPQKARQRATEIGGDTPPTPPHLMSE